MMIWNNVTHKTGGDYVVGNGDMVLFCRGPNINGLYSSLNDPRYIFSLTLSSDNDKLRSITERNKNDNSYKHIFYEKHSDFLSGNEKNNNLTEFNDILDVNQNLFIRNINSFQKIVLFLSVAKYAKVVFDTSYQASGTKTECIIISTENNSTGYNKYTQKNNGIIKKINTCLRLIIMMSGNVKCKKFPEIIIEPGKGSIIISADYGENFIKNALYSLSNPDLIINRNKNYWTRYLSGIKKISGQNEDNKLNDVLQNSILLLKSMQKKDGDIILSESSWESEPVKLFCMIKSLLEIGCVSEAKAALDFMVSMFWDGCHFISYIKSCGIFNEYASIPSCLLLAAANYLKKTNDNAYITFISPVLEDAYYAQKNIYKNRLITVSGSEDYIKYGYFPLDSQYMYSFCNTLLYIESKEVFINELSVYTNKNKTEFYKNDALNSINKFKKIFLEQDVFPSLIKKSKKENNIRRGICDLCGDFYYPRLVDSLEKNQSGNYVCPNCRSKIKEEYKKTDNETKEKKYIIADELLFPAFLQSSIITYDMTEKCINNYKAKSDYLYYTNDEKDKHSSIVSIAYLLYHYTAKNLSKAQNIYNHLIEKITRDGFWPNFDKSFEKFGGTLSPFVNVVCAAGIYRYRSFCNILSPNIE